MLQKSPEKKLNATQIKNDVLSGLTVALALVPEAIAFAFIAGVDPIIAVSYTHLTLPTICSV